jgi:hypothetical protein
VSCGCCSVDVEFCCSVDVELDFSPVLVVFCLVVDELERWPPKIVV